MTRRYFGTDGIRGRANASHNMTPEIALKVGMASSASASWWARTPACRAT